MANGMSTSNLEQTLGNSESFQIDVGLLVLHVHHLIVLSSPFISFIQLIINGLLWTNSFISVLMLVFINILCFMPTSGFYALLLCFITTMVFMGLVHQYSNCFVKVFPASKLTLTDLDNMDSPLTREQLSRYYRSMLYNVDFVVEKANLFLIKFYSFIQWKDLQLSSRFYTCLFIASSSLCFFSWRGALALIIDYLMFESKILIAIQEYAEYRRRKSSIEKIEAEKTLSYEEKDIDAINPEQINEIAADKADYERTDSDDSEEVTESMCDADSNLIFPIEIDCEKNENSPNEYHSDNSDYEEPPASDEVDNGENDNESKSKPSRTAGMVNKLIEFKKRHQTNTAGNCVSCNVAFSTILKRRHVCTHCGNHFCSRCCSQKVLRALLGATAPLAQTENVPVCLFCYMYLTGKK